MKRGTKMLAVVCVIGLCIIGGSVWAQQDIAGSLDIKAIKSMQLQSANGKYTADVGVVFVNKGEKDAKLRKASFEVSFKGEAVIPFGKANVEELVLPAGTKGDNGVKPSETEVTLKVDVGPQNPETTERLVKLFNVIGNPASQLTMLLNGTGEMGMKVEKGWVYQQNMAVELEFQPTIQRELLFK